MTLWLASGLRTPFRKDRYDPLGHGMRSSCRCRSFRQCAAGSKGDRPDLVVWGTVAPSLRWSNIAREVVLDAASAPRSRRSAW